jgi:hypothetical protein
MAAPKSSAAAIPTSCFSTATALSDFPDYSVKLSAKLAGK